MTEVEHRSAVQVRSAGRYLRGTVLRYGDVARGSKGPERFEARSLVSGVDTAALNLQHDLGRELASQPGNLRLTDSPTALELRAELDPGGAEARLVRRRTLRGLSVGFIALQEHQDTGVRVIERAHLDHVSLVDRPSYPGSTVEIRQAMADAWIKGKITYGRTMACRCAGPECPQVMFQPRSIEVAPSALAIGGSGYASVIGSLRRGNVVLRETDDSLEIGIVGGRDTEAGRRIVEAASVAPIFIRPILDIEASEFVESDGVRSYSKAYTRSFLVKTTDADSGHIPAIIDGVVGERRSRPRARRMWL